MGSGPDATDSITFEINGVTKTVNFIAGSAAADLSGTDTLNFGVDDTIDNLATALGTLFSSDTSIGGTITVNRASNAGITLTSDSSINSIQISDGQGGATLAELGLDSIAGGTAISGASNGDQISTRNATIEGLIAAGDTSLTLNVNGNGAQSVTLGGGDVSTLAGLVSAVNGLTGIDASANGSNGLTITPTTAGQSIEFGGDANVLSALGVSAQTYTGNDRTAESLGIAANDSFIVSVDGTDKTVSFDSGSAGSVSGDTLTIGINQDPRHPGYPAQ